MTIKIWHQSMTDLTALGQYKTALARHVSSVVDDGTEVVLHGLAPGTYHGVAPSDALKFPYVYHVCLSQVLDHVRLAEESGFDAVVLASWSEPFLREARSAVDIPVVSLVESNLLVGCSVAKRIGVISVTREMARLGTNHIDRHGLWSRVSGVYSLEPAVNEAELEVAFQDPSRVVETFLRTAEVAIDAGADVLIPAEGALSELMVTAGPQRLHEVSVMDGVGVALAYAELLVKLRARTGLLVGRRWEYPKADGDVARLLT